MIFNPNKTAFGRHETFALRFSWLTKGYQALAKNPDIFTEDESTIELGVGRNMVSSIRYWLLACQIVEQSTLTPSAVGCLIFDKESGFDPYLEDEATIWLIHWLLASNPELATAWYWFFNKYHKPEFTSQELTTALADFVKDTIIDGKRPSTSTLKNDAQLLHRMYTQTKGVGRTPLEEALDSPLALLNIMTQAVGGRRYLSRPESRPGLPLGILGFAVLQIMEQRSIKSIPIEELMYSRNNSCAPGAVFRLTENDLITKLENLVGYIPGVFDIRDTAGIHQVFLLKEIAAEDFIIEHYTRSNAEAAA